MAALSLPTRGAWIEIYLFEERVVLTTSLPTRGAWIEIGNEIVLYYWQKVAPHTGSVD